MKSKAALIFLSLSAFILFSGLILALLAVLSLRPVDPNSNQPSNFTISSGENLTSIATRLENQKLIRNATSLKLSISLMGLATKIQAGNFVISPSLSTPDIARLLTDATADSVVLTFLEGWRREEYADYLAIQLATNPNYSSAEFLDLTKALEGQLYPDTYHFNSDVSTAQIVTTLTTTFASKVTEPFATSIASSPFSLNQILTLASIVEREARGSAQPLVAGILIKRYQNDWPLQADATLQYIKGYDRTSQAWWTPPLAIDKDLNSPFNTYQNPGLPPAPIANPSLSAIQAVLNPQESDYWYYISDLEGNMHYAITYDDHLQNINIYLK